MAGRLSAPFRGCVNLRAVRLRRHPDDARRAERVRIASRRTASGQRDAWPVVHCCGIPCSGRVS